MSPAGSLALAALVIAATVLVAPMLGPGPRTHPVDADPTAEVTETRKRTAGNGLASRELERSSDGRFHAWVRVNGIEIRFLVDTGASLVALTSADARKVGLAPGKARSKAMTAGGEIEIAPVTIERLAIGPITADKVDAAIVEELPVSLLGQSFLDRLESVRIEGDRMILR